MQPSSTAVGAVVVLMCAAGVACATELPPVGGVYPSTPHGRYARALDEAGLALSELSVEWRAASERAILEAPPIDPPFHEAGYFDARRAEAVGYRLDVERGQVLSVQVAVGANAFVDVFRVTDSIRPPAHIASADRSLEISLFVYRTGTYIIRVQPELLAGGRYDVHVSAGASLAFPVAGHTLDAVRSAWGANRDGGRRQHEGIDIFAPRGTPALAAADGIVSSTRRNNLGGNVVWLRTSEQRANLYYAHLDTVLVRRGQRVQVGDTLGLVGNSGNARTTPPHLHFGIYSRGATDPDPFLRNPNRSAEPLAVDIERQGPTGRTNAVAPLRAGPSAASRELRTLPTWTLLDLTGGTGSWYRVRLPDGMLGFVAGQLVEPVAPLRDTTLTGDVAVLDKPDHTGEVVALLSGPMAAPVFARFDAAWYVRTETGVYGWLTESARGSTASTGAVQD